MTSDVCYLLIVIVIREEGVAGGAQLFRNLELLGRGLPHCGCPVLPYGRISVTHKPPAERAVQVLSRGMKR